MTKFTPETDVDVVLRALGKTGTYQISRFILLTLVTFPIAYTQLSIVFMGYDYPFRCRTHLNDTEFTSGDNITTTGQCFIIDVNATDDYNDTTECIYGYLYERPKEYSLVSEWDLVCDRDYLGELSQTMLMIGMVLGCFLCSSLADRFGRKPVHIVCHLLTFGLNIVTVFSTDITMFLAIRLTVGFTLQGSGIPCYILMLEMFPSELRFMVGVMVSIIWTISVSSLSPLMYLLSAYSWRYIQVLTCVVSAYSLIAYWLFDESLRWLIVNNRQKEATRLVKKIAKANKVDYNKVLKEIDSKQEGIQLVSMENKNNEKNDLEEQYLDNDISGLQDQYLDDGISGRRDLHKSDLGVIEQGIKNGILDVMQHPQLRLYTLVMIYIWLINSFTYYSLFLTSSSLAGDRFVNFMLISLVELPANLLKWPLLKRYGRKKTIIFYHAVAGISLLLTVIVLSVNGDNPAYLTAVTGLSLAGKFGVTGSWGTLVLFTPELYPTTVRNIGLGTASAAARIGGTLAPFSSYLSEYAEWAPGGIFGVCCLSICFLMLLFPETGDRELPQTIAEISEWDTRKETPKTHHP